MTYWTIKAPDGLLLWWGRLHLLRDEAQSSFAKDMGHSWKEMHANGYRCVRVRIEEVTAAPATTLSPKDLANIERATV